MCLETETPYSLRMEVTVSVVSAYSIIPFIKTGCGCRCFYCCFVVIDGADCCLFSFIKSNNCCLKSLLQRDDCCLSFVYCIGNIKLKIVQDKIKYSKKFFPKINNPSKIEERMNKVNDHQLKSSLNNFLKAFNERNK